VFRTAQPPKTCTTQKPTVSWIKLAAVLIACLVFTTSVAAKKQPLTLIPVNGAEQLSVLEKQGYLLLEIDVQGVAPAITLSKLSNSPNIAPQRKQTMLGTKMGQIELKGLTPGFYALALAPGLYRVDEVLSPLFNYSYRMNVQNQYQWRFTVEKGHINYFAKLHIAKARKANSVDLSLHNRYAYTLDLIQSGNLDLPEMAVRSAPGYRDDFAQFLAD
jgi:hypothetical protein